MANPNGGYDVSGPLTIHTPAATTNGSSISLDVVQSVTLLQSQVNALTSASRASIAFDEAVTLHGTALSYYMDTRQAHGFAMYQVPCAVGDSARLTFDLSAGDYTMNVLGILYTNHGIVSWILDGDDSAPVWTNDDWYNSNTNIIFNTVHSQTIHIPTSGRHTIAYRVTGKNSGSTSYLIPITKVWFEPVNV